MRARGCSGVVPIVRWAAAFALLFAGCANNGRLSRVEGPSPAISTPTRPPEVAAEVAAQRMVNNAYRGPKFVNVAAFETWRKSESVLVVADLNPEPVRDKYGSIPGSFVVDAGKFTVQNLGGDTSLPVVFCGLNRADPAPVKAAEQARTMGFRSVFVLLEGIEGWAANQPTQP